jgi:hypothetical protein
MGLIEMKGLTIARRYVFFIHRIRIRTWQLVPGWGEEVPEIPEGMLIFFYNFRSTLMTNMNTLCIFFLLGMKM